MAKGKQSFRSASICTSYQAAKAYHILDAAFVSAVVLSPNVHQMSFHVGCVFI